MGTATVDTARYISARRVREILGVHTGGFRRVVGSGAIGIRQLPGLAPKYNEADTQRLLAEATRPGRPLGRPTDAQPTRPTAA